MDAAAAQPPIGALSGRAYAVTGGFGVLGSALGQALVQAGAGVALIGRGRPPADEPAGALALGGVDLGDEAAAHAALGMGAYAAAKSGVARLTEAMAEELKDRGITVNAVLPSILDTAANRADMPKADPARWVSPQALARVVLFLLSDDAAPITGALIPVKGRV